VRFTDGDIGRTWSDGNNNYSTAFAGISISEAKLICEYRQLAASDADAVVQANFGSGQMTSLVSTFAKAVPVISANNLQVTANAELPIYVDLTENAAVENLYVVMAHVPRADLISTLAYHSFCALIAYLLSWHLLHLLVPCAMASHQSYCKRYYKAHREAILASQRLRRQDPANRVRMREYYARYYLTNRERILTQSRARRRQLKLTCNNPAVTFTHGRFLVLFD
jgi:hypothetical protein